MKKTLLLIAFCILIGAASFAQDSSLNNKPTNVHKNRMRANRTDSSSTNSGYMGTTPMQKQSIKKPGTTTTADSTK